MASPNFFLSTSFWPTKTGCSHEAGDDGVGCEFMWRSVFSLLLVATALSRRSCRCRKTSRRTAHPRRGARRRGCAVRRDVLRQRHDLRDNAVATRRRENTLRHMNSHPTPSSPASCEQPVFVGQKEVDKKKFGDAMRVSAKSAQVGSSCHPSIRLRQGFGGQL